MDLNGDGRIGGPGTTAKIEQATHVDLNRDGIIGGYRPPADGGKHFSHCKGKTKFVSDFIMFFFRLGLVGKIEKATHIDLNRDGYIGGRPGYLPPQPHHKH